MTSYDYQDVPLELLDLETPTDLQTLIETLQEMQTQYGKRALLVCRTPEWSNGPAELRIKPTSKGNGGTRGKVENSGCYRGKRASSVPRRKGGLRKD